MSASVVKSSTQNISPQNLKQTGQPEPKKGPFFHKGFVEHLELLLQDKFPIYTSKQKQNPSLTAILFSLVVPYTR